MRPIHSGREGGSGVQNGVGCMFEDGRRGLIIQGPLLVFLFKKSK
jgi:hypothetical protein